MSLVFKLFIGKKRIGVDTDVKQMANNEIEERIAQLEEEYTQALKVNADIHALSRIWQGIKELKAELKLR
jgi:glycine cleavage system regulatory protein